MAQASEIHETAPLDIDASVRDALAACDGDAMAALRAVIILNAYLDTEAERLSNSVSKGFARGARRSGLKGNPTERHLIAVEVAIGEAARHMSHWRATIVGLERSGRTVKAEEEMLLNLAKHQALEIEHRDMLRRLVVTTAHVP